MHKYAALCPSLQVSLTLVVGSRTGSLCFIYWQSHFTSAFKLLRRYSIVRSLYVGLNVVSHTCVVHGPNQAVEITWLGSLMGLKW